MAFIAPRLPHPDSMVEKAGSRMEIKPKFQFAIDEKTATILRKERTLVSQCQDRWPPLADSGQAWLLAPVTRTRKNRLQSPLPELRSRAPGLGVVRDTLGFGRVLDLHIPELLRIKHFAALQAFDKLGVLVAGDDAYPRVSASGGHLS